MAALVVVSLALSACASKRETPVVAQSPSLLPASLSNAQIAEGLRALDFDAMETVRGVVVILPDVFLFEFGRSEINAAGQAKLAQLATYLNQPTTAMRRLAVEGHTDSIGGDAANQALSERRAAAVVQELVAGKVLPSRVTSRGLGEKTPVQPNTLPDGRDNPEGRAKNRRVEVVVQS